MPEARRQAAGQRPIQLCFRTDTADGLRSGEGSKPAVQPPRRRPGRSAGVTSRAGGKAAGSSDVGIAGRWPRGAVVRRRFADRVKRRLATRLGCGCCSIPTRRARTNAIPGVLVSKIVTAAVTSSGYENPAADSGPDQSYRTPVFSVTEASTSCSSIRTSGRAQSRQSAPVVATGMGRCSGSGMEFTGLSWG
jgi:hypothetical protein